MKNMKTDFQNSRDMHIDAIRRQHGITLNAVSRCYDENKNEIQNIKNIFFLKGGDKHRVLALLYLLNEDDVIEKYRMQAGLLDESFNPAGLAEQYKLLLVTALIYNTGFYAMACNFCAALDNGITIGESSEEVLPEQKKNDAILPFTLTRRSLRKYSGLIIAAAAGIVVILFFALLARPFPAKMGEQLINPWVSSLKEPEKDSRGIAYISAADEGARMEIQTPLVGTAMGVGDAVDTTSAKSNPAIAYYTKAINKNKDSSSLYVNRGVAYTVNGYLDSAIADFSRAIDLNPGNAAAYYNRAIAYAGKGENAQAIIDMQKAIDRDPDDRESRYVLGALYYRKYDDNKNQGADSLQYAIDAFSQIQGYKDADTLMSYLLKRKP